MDAARTERGELTFPRSRRRLREMFEGGALPRSEEFEGEYAVDILTGLVPSGRAFGHRKRFTTQDGSRQTYNVLFRDYRFGYFCLEACRPDRRSIAFNYDDPRNILLRRMRDEVRRVGEGAYLGSYNFFVGGRLRFVGFFSMLKVGGRP